MVFDGKTVRLVLDPGDQLKAFGMAVDGDLHILKIQPSGPMAVILHHAADRDVQTQFPKHLKGYVHLAPAAVHHDQIREPGKAAQPVPLCLPGILLLFFQPMLKPPGEHFFHRRVVVGPLNGFYPELPVIVALGPSILIHHHGAHRFKTADIGNIEGFYPAHAGKSQPFSDLVHGADGPKLLPLDLFLILRQNKKRVFRRQLHQPFLLSLFGNHEFHALAPPFRKPLSHQLHFIKLLLGPDLPGNKRRSRIELLDKASQDLSVLLRRRGGNMEMLSSDQLPVPHKKHLHHRVLVVPGHGDNIPVFHALAGDLLLLGHLLYTV